MRVLGHDGIALPEPVVRASRALQDWLQELDGDSPLVAKPPEELVLERVAGADAQRLQEFLSHEPRWSCHESVQAKDEHPAQWLLLLLSTADHLNMPEAQQLLQQQLAHLLHLQDVWLLQDLPSGLAWDTLECLLSRWPLHERMTALRIMDPRAPWPHIGHGMQQGTPAMQEREKTLMDLMQHQSDVVPVLPAPPAAGDWLRWEHVWTRTNTRGCKTCHRVPGELLPQRTMHIDSLLRISVACPADQQPCWSLLREIAPSSGGWQLLSWSGQDASELLWLTGTPLPAPTRRWDEDAQTYVVTFVLPLLPTCSSSKGLPKAHLHELNVKITLAEHVSMHAVECLRHASELPTGTMHSTNWHSTLFVELFADHDYWVLHACFGWIRFQQRRPAYRRVCVVQSLYEDEKRSDNNDTTSTTLYECTHEQNRQMQHALSLAEHRPWLVPIPLFLCRPTSMVNERIRVHVDVDAGTNVAHEWVCLQLNAYQCNGEVGGVLCAH